MVSRSLLAFISLIFTAGGLLLMFLIMLAGTIDHSPVNKYYFLQVDTSSIPGAAAVSRWTFWNICSIADNVDSCGAVHPAFPFDPPSGRNFGTTKNIPAAFIGTRKYFYMTRFMFAFALIAMFFAVCSLLTGVLALCTRLASYFSGLLSLMALIFQSAVAALMTCTYVLGRDHFRKNGEAASLGEYAFGFEWAAWACLFISTILFCKGGGKNKADPTTYDANRRSFFSGTRTKSTKSNRSRGSLTDEPVAEPIVDTKYEA